MTPIGRWNNQSIYDTNNDIVIEDQSRQEFTDAINHCLDLLRENNYITDINMDVISRRSAVVGQEMYEYLKQIMMKEINAKSVGKIDAKTSSNIQIVNCEHSINSFIKQEPIEIIDTQQPEILTEQKSIESKEKRKFRAKTIKKRELNDDNMIETNVKISNVASRLSEKKLPKRLKNGKREYSLIPLDLKTKVLNIAYSNPTWGLKELREYGYEKLNNMGTLRKWKMHVDSGGAKQDKLNTISCITYMKYQEACNNNQIVTTSMIREWAMKAAERYSKVQFKFKASSKWINGFKLQHGIILPEDTIEPDNELICDI